MTCTRGPLTTILKNYLFIYLQFSPFIALLLLHANT
uniref:Uncharacterized protein n=1 Tax=Rhizophora mucronata TaxID=61149 RepID=A0A2P2PW11_RHIMU